MQKIGAMTDLVDCLRDSIINRTKLQNLLAEFIAALINDGATLKEIAHFKVSLLTLTRRSLVEIMNQETKEEIMSSIAKIEKRLELKASEALLVVGNVMSGQEIIALRGKYHLIHPL